MYNKNIGRSLCRRRPVSMPEPAGLYAGIGRSVCRRRPVSMPASAGLYAGQPLSDCVAVPSGGFLSGKTASQKKTMHISRKIGVCFCSFCYFGKRWPKCDAQNLQNNNLVICKKFYLSHRSQKTRIEKLYGWVN